MSQPKPQAPRFKRGDVVALKDTPGARKYGKAAKMGEVIEGVAGSAWVKFPTARGEREAWIPDEHLEPLSAL